MLTPQLLEAINGTLLVIFLGLDFFFARYILLEFLRPNISWRQARRNRTAAIAVLMVLIGETLIRGSVWGWRHFNAGEDNFIVNLGVSIGVVISIVGGVCALRHFAPDSWGNAPWILIPIIGLVFGIGMAL
jgi:protein-S-isoprenylcysteine O-methyltransferase Ste14